MKDKRQSDGLIKGYWSLALWGLWGFKNASNWYGVITKCNTDQIIKKIRVFRVFLIFFKYFFQNEVRFNLTSKTSKYYLDVSQLSDQCYSGFLLSLPTKNRSTFFRNFSLGSPKKSYFEFEIEISKRDW
jgi:hypothetical protein